MNAQQIARVVLIATGLAAVTAGVTVMVGGNPWPPALILFGAVLITAALMAPPIVFHPGASTPPTT